jgi:hypothetical protein
MKRLRFHLICRSILYYCPRMLSECTLFDLQVYSTPLPSCVGMYTFVFPKKDIEIKSDDETSIHEISSFHYKTCSLLDASLHYTINKTWGVGVCFTNILDTSSSVITQNIGFHTVLTALSLCPYEFLAQVLLRC